MSMNLAPSGSRVALKVPNGAARTAWRDLYYPYSHSAWTLGPQRAYARRSLPSAGAIFCLNRCRRPNNSDCVAPLHHNVRNVTEAGSESVCGIYTRHPMARFATNFPASHYLLRCLTCWQRLLGFQTLQSRERVSSPSIPHLGLKLEPPPAKEWYQETGGWMESREVTPPSIYPRNMFVFHVCFLHHRALHRFIFAHCITDLHVICKVPFASSRVLAASTCSLHLPTIW
ncbi:hypothetical protein BU16DRAFT_226828 [Lophium mytilinum]|uniref:Uncharacterized protein n=1 Tax=Lophium mytilinum TaxID=390894 RepID=A0A6A6QA06_9PEZI|nr:hypothetical protein BU16DRAFT_226828 [Lophium mytilinum]